MLEAERGNYQVISFRGGTEETEELIESYNHMIRQINDLIHDVYLAQIEQKNAQYTALQTQINPHMLYNTLEAIRMNAMMSGADETAEMIKILSKMFRSVLSQDIERHTLGDELEYAGTYLQIQNIRKQDMFSLETEIPPELPAQPVIPVILQPLIENSIRHGFRGYQHPLHIRIKGERTEEGGIRLTVSDDGKGMTEAEIEERNRELAAGEAAGSLPSPDPRGDDGHGIGLENIRDRLRLYYGEKAGVRFVKTEGGCGVELYIPGGARKGEGKA